MAITSGYPLSSTVEAWGAILQRWRVRPASRDSDKRTTTHPGSFLQFRRPVGDQLKRRLRLLLGVVHQQTLAIRRDVKRYPVPWGARVEQMLARANFDL